MIDVDIKIDNSINKNIQNAKVALANYPKQAEAKLKSLTPIDTGNARNKTRLVGKDKIEANYPYAQRLDQGWSKQAPEGMTKPFGEWVQEKMKYIFGK